jgi:hypothetical protein
LKSTLQRIVRGALSGAPVTGVVMAKAGNG